MGIFRRRELADPARQDDFVLEAEVEAVLAVRAAGKGEVYWGAPTRCPECGVYGFVDEVDHAGGRTRNRCLSRECGTEWTITRRAIREAKRRVGTGAASPAVATPGAGVAVPIPEDSPLFTSEDEAPEWEPFRSAEATRWSEPEVAPAPTPGDTDAPAALASRPVASRHEPTSSLPAVEEVFGSMRVRRSTRDRIA